MSQYQTYAAATPLVADIIAFYKSSSGLMRTTTLTDFIALVESQIAASFTDVAVMPNTVPTSGQIPVGTGAAYIPRTISGDVTVNGTGVATVGVAAITYAKIQDVSAISKLLGRGSAAGAGDVEEITLGTGLTMVGTTINATAGAGNMQQGSDASEADHVFVSAGADKTHIETPVIVDPTTGAVDGARVTVVQEGGNAAITNEMTSRVMTNQGTAALAEYTLPTAVAGLTYTFIVQDVDGIKVIAAAADTIRLAASVSAAAGFASCTVIGNTLTLVAINATEWVATSVNGTWTVT
jgi:hypothetical protein